MFRIFKLTVAFHQVDTKEEKSATMHDISKHNSEEEWEHDDCENSGIDFLISRNSVGIHDLLEDIGEFIQLKVSGGRLLG